MPVRKIGMSSRAVTSNFFSVKNNRTMHRCESMLELDYLYHLEFDDQVVDYEMQPVYIPFVNLKGKKTKYPPDVKVQFTKEGKKVKGFPYSIIEVKFNEELEEKEKEYEPKFIAVDKYCKENNCGFDIITETFIRTPILGNYKFFYRYLPTQSLPKVPTDVLGLATKLGTFNAREYVNLIEGNELIKGQTLANLWHQVACKRLQIDWNTSINMNSKITAISL